MDFLALEERFGPKLDYPTKEEIAELTNQAKIYLSQPKNESLESSLENLNLSNDQKNNLQELIIFNGRDLTIFSNFILDNLAKNATKIEQYQIIVDTGCKMNLSYTSGFYEGQKIDSSKDDTDFITKKFKIDLIILSQKTGYLQISEDLPNYLISKLITFLQNNLQSKNIKKLRFIENQKESKNQNAPNFYMYGGEGDYDNSENSDNNKNFLENIQLNSILSAPQERIDLNEKQEKLEQELGPDPFVKRGFVPEKYSRLGQELIFGFLSDEKIVKYYQVKEEACGIPDLELVRGSYTNLKIKFESKTLICAILTSSLTDST